MRGNNTTSVSYIFDNAPAGTYEITLSFIEPQFSTPGVRLFDVSVESTVVIDDLDLVE